ncbi:MAG: FHA domain-containing protein [Planctomycetes bacterium]|nr:FHA domain-containing protein [Planctomycetota bacterium]
MPYLEVLDGRFRGRRIPLRGGDFLVGREKGKNHLVLDDEVVSRRHVRFRIEGDKTVVEDLKSNNGTFLNGGRISGAVELSPGDEVGIGATHFRFDAQGTDGAGQEIAPAGETAAPGDKATLAQPRLGPADRPPPDTVRRPPEKAEPGTGAEPGAGTGAEPGAGTGAEPGAGTGAGAARGKEAKVKEWLEKIEAERREKERSAGLLSEDLSQRAGAFRFLVYVALAGGGLALAGLVYYLVLVALGDV